MLMLDYADGAHLSQIHCVYTGRNSEMLRRMKENGKRARKDHHLGDRSGSLNSKVSMTLTTQKHGETYSN